MKKSPQPRAQFSGRMAFILAAVGAAVGLGNIWKFPYITGLHGGGAFIIVYLICIALIGVPIFIAELYIGKEGQADVLTAFRKHKSWRWVGMLSLITAIMVLSVYCIIGGWILDFEFQSLLGEFSGGGEGIKSVVGPLERETWRQLLGTGLFYVVSVGIVMGGVTKGIELANKLLIPSLVVLLGLLFVICLFLPGAGKAFEFLFYADWSKLTSAGIVEAVGHAFFTLSVGIGAIITYGSYLSKHGQNLSQISFIVAGFDTAIALLVGFVIFAVGFSFADFEPNGGPTLIFQTIPALFSQLSWGYIGSVLFFLLVAFAAITSTISMFEIVVAAISENTSWSRNKSLLVSGGALFVFSLVITFFFDPLFHWIDEFTTHLLLPIGGLGISLYTGWILGPAALKKVTGGKENWWYHFLLWALRVLAPVAIVGILIQGVVG